MEEIISKYFHILNSADYEVIKTPKLGWIIVRTDYEHYSNPIVQLHDPKKLEDYILNVK